MVAVADTVDVVSKGEDIPGDICGKVDKLVETI